MASRVRPKKVAKSGSRSVSFEEAISLSGGSRSSARSAGAGGVAVAGGAGAAAVIALGMRRAARDAEEARAELKDLAAVVEGKRVRGKRPQRLVHEKAGEILAADVKNILERAQQAMSTEDGYLESDEVKAIKQDLAAAALLFHEAHRAGGGVGREERMYIQRLLREFVPLVQGERGSPRAAARKLDALFRPRAGSSEVRVALRSLLNSSEMKRLASALRSPSTKVTSRSATLSASRSSQVAKRARAAVLRKRQAAGSRSGDSLSAGSKSKEFVRTASGSLRSARTATRTSSKSFNADVAALVDQALRSLNIARDRPRRGAKPISRFGGSLIAVRELEDLVKQHSRARGADRKRELKVEFIMTVLLRTPSSMSRASQQKLGAMFLKLFPTADPADVQVLARLISKKERASILKAKPYKARALREAVFRRLQKILPKSVVKAVNKEIKHLSSVSSRSPSSLAARSSEVLVEKVRSSTGASSTPPPAKRRMRLRRGG
jgi:hypothetical protein